MNLSRYSEFRFDQSAISWGVNDEYYLVMKNYLIYGFHPGRFFTSLLANDAFGAISHSHPMNTIDALKNLVAWINRCVPREAYGDYDSVQRWCSMPEEQRRVLLAQARLIYSPEEEVFIALKDKNI